MRRTRFALVLLTGLGMFAAGCATSSSTDRETSVSQPDDADDRSTDRTEFPETRRGDTVEQVHGREVRDPYRWLEPNDDEAVVDWMDRQDGYAREYLHERPQRKALRARYEELYYIESTSRLIPRGDRLFYARQKPTEQKDIYYWRPVDQQGSGARMLLDPNDMRGDTNVSIGALSPSPEGRKVAYTVNENNADAATLYVKDVDTGEVSETDVIEGAKWAEPSWTPNGEGFYYTHYPTDPDIADDKRPGLADVRYHELGTDPADDTVVREPTGDSRTFQSIDLSHDGRWLVATVYHGWSSSDVYYRDREADDPTWQPLVTGRDDLYDVTAWRGDFYIRTDEGASNYRVMKAPAEKPARDNWHELVEESDDGVLERLEPVGGHILLTYMRNAHNRLEIRRRDGSHLRDIDLPGTGSVSGISGEPDADTAYFAYESFTSPQRLYRTSIASGGTDVWSETTLPVDTSELTVDQVWYESRDGTRVSMFLIHKKGIEKDGSTPFLLYGYGGFDVSLTPHFRQGVMPWLEAGGGYAVPNLRGGGEYGEDWHEAGMLENKQNVFDDFIAAAEFLVDRGYTSSDRLAIEGRSNGGLLVSAVTTQRPDLFRAVVCGVPLTDMVRYDEFGPGSIWIHEYGDPSNPEHFEFLYDYSPYHHVEKGTAYPAFLMMSSARDDRVHPMHARKMTGALQWATSSDHPMILRVEREAGHGGADRLKNRVEKATDRFAFLMSELGVDYK